MDTNIVHQTGLLPVQPAEHSTWLTLVVFICLFLLARYIFRRISNSLEITIEPNPSFLKRSEQYMKEFWEKD